jgi:hypothetical protein
VITLKVLFNHHCMLKKSGSDGNGLIWHYVAVLEGCLSIATMRPYPRAVSRGIKF